MPEKLSAQEMLNMTVDSYKCDVLSNTEFLEKLLTKLDIINLGIMGQHSLCEIESSGLESLGSFVQELILEVTQRINVEIDRLSNWNKENASGF